MNNTITEIRNTLLLLSCFSRVRCCATPQTAAHQAPPSLGFSRQEYWSGLPFPFPMHASMLSRFSRVRLCAALWTAAHQAPPANHMGFVLYVTCCFSLATFNISVLHLC